MQINRDFTECDKENIQQFVDYFRQGCKENHTDALGMEIEHFIVDKKNKSMVNYYGERGIEALLERLSPYFSEKGIREGHLVGLGNEEYVITIEPAGQLEISITPQERMESVKGIYETFHSVIAPVLKEWDYELVTAGYCLKEKSEELALIPKKRYEYMNRYFEEIGMYGRCMMRGTASVQCAVDYCCEEDFVRTYRAAVALGPLLALLTDNSPIFEGQPWEKHMARTFIWERVDKERCGVVPGTFEEGFGFEAYGKYLYQVPLIFIEQDSFCKEKCEESKNESVQWDLSQNIIREYVGRQSLKRLCSEKNKDICTITKAQLEHAMSMVFPDVRLKQYIEIRVGDSMPWEYALSYGTLIKGLFLNRDKLYELYKQLEQYTQFGRMTEEEVEVGKNHLIEYGYAGIIYGKSAGYWLEKMIGLAIEQLSDEDKVYLEPMLRLVYEKKSVRDVTKMGHIL